MASVVWLTAGSAAAWPMNVNASHGSPPPGEQNSCVVFDIPIDSSTYLPVGSGAPAASRGTMAAARPAPAAAWSAGMALLLG
jgi:hypothetical protein